MAQKLINGNELIANKISKIAKLMEVQSNKIVIQQGDDDTDILFIVSGSVSILVNKSVWCNKSLSGFGVLA
jgi:CRP-like cAMP-binding protein